MPELPEVRTVAEYLNKNIKKLKFKSVDNFTPKLIWRNDEKWFLKTVIGKEILNVSNYGKYLLFELKDYMIISHLRMEGKWSVSEYKEYVYPKQHLRIEFEMSNDKYLRYYDSRKFGTLEMWEKDSYIKDSGMANLGPEPLNNQPSLEYLKDKAKNSNTKVKTFLLDQSVVCGIGNIYVNEILFAANVMPDRIVKTLTNKELEDIIKYSNKILETSIKMKGTSIHSYKSGDNESGQYQNELKVHLRENEPCKICNTPIIKTKINGRGTYYCRNCQI